MNSIRHRERISPWENPVTRALRAGKVCVGACSISLPCAAVAQISAAAGFGFFYFDMEHSHLPIEEVEPICNAAKLTGITPIAGTTGIADFLISRPLDSGAMGVIVPHVSTADEVRLIVNACRYVPKGTRGLIDYGMLTEFRDVNTVEWVEAMNREILVAVKVESVTGIENIEEIAAVPGLDAVLIGPGDLSASYELPGQTNHPRLREAIDRMIAACKRNGISGGPHVSSAAAAREWADRGATFMSCSFDGALLLEASSKMAGEVRDLLGDRLG